MKKNRYKIYTLGCKVNQYDSENLSRRFGSIGWRKAVKKADLAIINSCAVTSSAIRKSMLMVKRARKENPKAKILLAGCWPRIEIIGAGYPGVDSVITDKEPENAIAEISKQFNFKKSHGLPKKEKIIFNPEKSRYFLKIQDGCNQYCSYCVVPYARGGLNSRLPEDVLDEIAQAAAVGYHEIVLCGIHLGLYGADLAVKVNLAELLEEAVKIKKLGRIRLSSLEITEVDEELIYLMAHNKKICRHLHIPLQSGSDKILKLMNRPYSKKHFEDKVKKIRQSMPDIAITTDIIVGFPGESDEDFHETREMVKRIGFSRLHVFPFSARSKTLAAKMPGKIDSKKIKIRAVELRETGKKLEVVFKKKFAGKNLEVVIEQQGKNLIKGKTQYYFDVFKKVKIQRNMLGKIIKANEYIVPPRGVEPRFYG